MAKNGKNHKKVIIAQHHVDIQAMTFQSFCVVVTNEFIVCISRVEFLCGVFIFLYFFRAVVSANILAFLSSRTFYKCAYVLIATVLFFGNK